MENSRDFPVLKTGQKVQIVYFSGTGGAARVAAHFEKALNDKGVPVVMVPLDRQEPACQTLPEIADSVGLLLLIYAVYAFAAPAPVYEWIDGIPGGSTLPCCVLSVSGGGEIWPNTACRVECIERLENKGYTVFYERMLVMPSNIFVESGEQLSAHLLEILPQKAEHSVHEILTGVRRRRKKPFGAKMMAAVSRIEKGQTPKFGSSLKGNESCTGCGWCAKKCPRENIQMIDGRPRFGNSCVICLRCVYGCPSKAIISKHYGALLLKGGYSLPDIEKKKATMELLPVNTIKTGLLMAGVKKYLQDIKA